MLDVGVGVIEKQRGRRCTLYKQSQEQETEVYPSKNADNQIKKQYTFQTTYFIPIYDKSNR